MTEPALRFLPLGFDLAKEEEAVLEKIHAALDRLTQRRKRDLPVSSHWLQQVLREALLYRVVATASGTIVNWNTGNVLCSFLAARGLFETFAFLWDYRRAVTKARQSGTLEELDKLTLKALAATKNPKWIEAHPEWEATNILTAINRLSEHYPGARNAYDELSYRCHPNSEGTFYMFADLDEHAQSVKFSDHNENAAWAFRLVVAVTALITEAEGIFSFLEENMSKVAAELKERRFRKDVAEAEQERKQFAHFVKEEEKALQGDAVGQFNIGTAYATGSSTVPQNLVLAHVWLSLSARQGNDPAVRSREKLAGGMTATQIAEAERLASEWKPWTTQQFADNDKYWREWKPDASDWP